MVKYVVCELCPENQRTTAVLHMFVSLCCVFLLGSRKAFVLLPNIKQQQLNVVFIQLGSLINICH